MIEAIVSAVKETVKEISSSAKDIMPRFFNELPKNEKQEGLDTAVDGKKTNDSLSGTISLRTKNESLEGEQHPITGVPFERKTIETDEKIEGVFPKFESEFDAQLSEELYQSSDAKQFKESNAQLKEAVANDPELAKKFNAEQLEQIMSGDTPDGYVWHHDAEPGKMQLVDFETHANTGHTGGKVVWGGGNENR